MNTLRIAFARSAFLPCSSFYFDRPSRVMSIRPLCLVSCLFFSFLAPLHRFRLGVPALDSAVTTMHVYLLLFEINTYSGEAAYHEGCDIFPRWCPKLTTAAKVCTASSRVITARNVDKQATLIVISGQLYRAHRRQLSSRRERKSVMSIQQLTATTTVGHISFFFLAKYAGFFCVKIGAILALLWLVYRPYLARNSFRELNKYLRKAGHLFLAMH